MYGAKEKAIPGRPRRNLESCLDNSRSPHGRNSIETTNPAHSPPDMLWPPLSASLVRRELLSERIDFGDKPIVAPLSLMLPPEPGRDPLDKEQSAIGAFGMFWKRSMIAWAGSPRLLGQRSKHVQPVNFARQTGIYLLHDDARTIYVGRAGDSVYTRLKAHTSDRMAGRWNRFSWFGLRRVTADGHLVTSRSVWSDAVVISTLEALLIESVEPPLNRRGGDGLAGLEYLQVFDPASTIPVPTRSHARSSHHAGAPLD